MKYIAYGTKLTVAWCVTAKIKRGDDVSTVLNYGECDAMRQSAVFQIKIFKLGIEQGLGSGLVKDQLFVLVRL